LKIVLDATALYGQFGGIETALWQTISHLNSLNSDHEFVVYIPRDAPDLEATLAHPLWKIERLSFAGSQKLRRIIWQQLELPQLLKTSKADLLHAPTYVSPLISPVPVVLGVPDLIALNRPRFATTVNRLHYRAVMPRALKNAAKIIVTTQKTATEVLRRIPRAECRVVPLGVEPIFFETIDEAQKQSLREKYKLPADFLLYIGNFEPKKNLLRLLQALDILGESAPPLVIAGGIKPWPEIEKQLSKVQKLGFLPREEIPVLLSMCRVFCFPSLCEGFGMPVIEALACGANVVASTQVPLPDLARVAQTPEPRSAHSIANAIREALNQPQPNQAAREYAKSFTWQRTALQTLSVYEELAP
jgi:glycosyltransferase involved in cell wall biosynthesis